MYVKYVGRFHMTEHTGGVSHFTESSSICSHNSDLITIKYKTKNKLFYNELNSSI